MPRKREGLQKVSVRLYEGEKDELADFYPEGHNWAIRNLVHAHLKKLKELRNHQISTSIEMEITLGEPE